MGDTIVLDGQTSIVLSGGFDADGFANGTYPSGDMIFSTATTLREYLMKGCVNITSVDAPAATMILERAFAGCTNLKSVNTPLAEEIRNYAFIDCTHLETVNAPEAYTVMNYAFKNCQSLKKINFPKAESIGVQCFHSVGTEASPVESIVLPSVESLNTECFMHAHVNAIDIGPGIGSLPSGAFSRSGDNYIPILILRSHDVVTTSTAGAIAGITANTKVYVPQDLIASYKAASRWSDKGDIFYPIEGSEYETKYADGTPIQPAGGQS